MIVLPLLIILLFICIYLYLTWNFNYWTKRGVNGPKPTAFIGTCPEKTIKKRNIIFDMHNIYQKYKHTENYVGMFVIQEPQLLILSPKLAHEILVTKFQYFRVNLFSKWVNQKTDKVISKNPFLLNGHEWKEKRAEVTPALSSNKIKQLYPIIQKSCKNMTNFIKLFSQDSEKESIETIDLSMRYTADVVADCTYGFEAKSFDFNTTSPIHEGAQRLFTDFSSALSFLSIANVIPFFKKLFNVRFMSQETQNFFLGLMKDAIEIRRNSELQRADFLHYLLQLQEKKNISLMDMTSHITTFFLEGYDTSASLISHCLLLLGRDERAQNKLRQEIHDNLDSNGILKFEALAGMQYLDNCCYETLRLFPPILFISKICTKSVELENLDNRKLKLSPGDSVHIPLYSFHKDERTFNDPEMFLPERFEKPNSNAKSLRDEGKFMPFSNGPRICLGMKFAMYQGKAAICEIIKNFEVTVNEKTRTDNSISATGLTALLVGGIWLNFKKIT